jgi:hypothetical protein
MVCSLGKNLLEQESFTVLNVGVQMKKRALGSVRELLHVNV